MPTNRRLVAGPTTGWTTATCRSGDERRQCYGFDRLSRYRSWPQSTPTCTIISTRSAISSVAMNTSFDARQPLLSGSPPRVGLRRFQNSCVNQRRVRIRLTAPLKIEVAVDLASFYHGPSNYLRTSLERINLTVELDRERTLLSFK